MIKQRATTSTYQNQNTTDQEGYAQDVVLQYLGGQNNNELQQFYLAFVWQTGFDLPLVPERRCSNSPASQSPVRY